MTGGCSRKCTQARPAAAAIAIAATPSATAVSIGLRAGVGGGRARRSRTRGIRQVALEGHASLADVAQPGFHVAIETAPQHDSNRLRRLNGQPAEVDLAPQHVGQRVGHGLAVEQPRPVSISHSTTPNDQMSARLSTGFPAACSGDM